MGELPAQRKDDCSDSPDIALGICFGKLGRHPVNCADEVAVVIPVGVVVLESETLERVQMNESMLLKVVKLTKSPRTTFGYCGYTW